MKNLHVRWAVLTFALALASIHALHAQVTLVNIAHTNNSGTAQGIVLSNNFAYVTAGTNGLLLYDVSNPYAPRLTGHAGNTNPPAFHLAISSNFAYVTTSGTAGFNVYDVSNPSSPSNVFRTNLNVYGGLLVDGTNLYVGGDSRLPIFNISTPTNPVLVTNPSIVPNPQSMAIGSNFLVAAGGNLEAGFLSNGFYTASLESVYLTNTGVAVAVQGQYAFVADTSPAASPPLLSVHILTNSLPVVGGITYPSTNAAGAGYSVAISGSYAYLGCAGGVRVINISNPSKLVPVGQTANAYGGIPYGIALSGPYAYVANGSDGLRVIEIIPSLTVKPSGSTLLFSWPATSSFALQQKPLTGTNWMTLTNVPVLVNGTNEVSLVPSGMGAFYRLISM